MALIISAAAFISTFFGGLFALRFKDKLHLILGFSAGAVIGVAFFDLMPEAARLAIQTGICGGNDISFITSLAALGFVVYMILDRVFIAHESDHAHDGHHHSHGSERRGKLGAASLAVHSLLDGIAIGIAFQVSVAIGVIVAIAVLVHDFSDGINTVNMIVKNKGGRAEALRWLVVDAFAPVLGVVATFFFTVPESALGVVLAIFSGFFLYIGASDLLPESHHNHPTIGTTCMTIIGMAVLYFAVKFAGT